MDIALFAGAAAASALLTWLARRYALARRLVDEPGERRSHVMATPRGGGVAIVLVMLAGLARAGATGPGIAFAACSATGLVLVAGIGWWDDHRPLSARLRLAVHVLAGLFLAAGLWCAGLNPVAVAVVAVAAVVLINVWNFMDGINGLAASQAALVAAAASLLVPSGPDFPLGWLMVAACIGFLPFNFPGARIFLGDVGSGALGYLLAMLAGLSALEIRSTAFGPAGAMLLLFPASAFLVDATLTLARRILRRERWWEPHVQHAYQSLARRRGHAVTTMLYGAWSAAGVLLTFTVATPERAFGFIMLAAVAAWQGLGALWWWYLQDSERRMTARGPRE